MGGKPTVKLPTLSNPARSPKASPPLPVTLRLHVYRFLPRKAGSKIRNVSEVPAVSPEPVQCPQQSSAQWLHTRWKTKPRLTPKISLEHEIDSYDHTGNQAVRLPV
ncbi:hypothetical protein E5288_WYG022240 [Bos mutus]|uniref:Uncharacterized protein n=1 Tax=Bos mutus TaxID=72004 RepID=A0A6B0S0L3_9CETA|nr:hypothetical protein [Bos mutus]